jgi:transposase, IS5 family
MTQINFFDLDNRYAELSKSGDALERLKQVIDFELFRPKLESLDVIERKNNSGRPLTDRVLLFKMLVLQRMYNLSDEQTEYQIKDRLSFMRFLDLEFSSTIPDAKTLWAYRDKLSKSNVVEELFHAFNNRLINLGVRLNQGQIIDASFVEAPRQRNSRKENEEIKSGKTPEDWSAKKRMHKDVDATWTKKNDETHYGYKNTINVDSKTKIIVEYKPSVSSVHDSQVFGAVVRPSIVGGKSVYADSAYVGPEIEKIIESYDCKSKIHEKGYRNHALTEKQKKMNHRKSKVRCRVEHVFGFMTNTMKGMTVRCIGITRANLQIGMMNLVYNLRRVECLIRNHVLGDISIIASKIR